MKNKYYDLVDQTFDFPQDEFRTEDGELYFHDIPLMEVIKQYGTPLKITYLPKITSQIQRAKRMFNVAIAKTDYNGTYNYCYCTKSSHFSFVLEEALKNDINLETSSAFDINLVQELYAQQLIDKEIFIICNGYKRQQYIENIVSLHSDGFSNIIPILDNKHEYYTLDSLLESPAQPMKLGIRIASEEEPKFDFYTSRLGMRYSDIVSFYEEKVKPNKKFVFKMLHFILQNLIRNFHPVKNSHRIGTDLFFFPAHTVLSVLPLCPASTFLDLRVKAERIHIISLAGNRLRSCSCLPPILR